MQHLKTLQWTEVWAISSFNVMFIFCSLKLTIVFSSSISDERYMAIEPLQHHKPSLWSNRYWHFFLSVFIWVESSYPGSDTDTRLLVQLPDILLTTSVSSVYVPRCSTGSESRRENCNKHTRDRLTSGLELWVTRVTSKTRKRRQW